LPGPIERLAKNDVVHPRVFSRGSGNYGHGMDEQGRALADQKATWIPMQDIELG
jgi:hypothetical protein